MKRTITFQTGVDVLGNPTFIKHHIIQDNPHETKTQPNKRFIAVLVSPIFKQY